MVTGIMNFKWKPNRTYKPLCDRCNRIRNKSETWYEVKCGEQVFDVRKSLVYLATKSLQDDFEKEFAESLSTEAAEALVKKCSSKLYKTNEGGPKTVANKKNNPKNQFDIDMMEHLAGCGSISEFVMLFDAIVHSSKRLSYEMYTVGIMMSMASVNNKIINIPNIVNAHALLIYYWFYMNDGVDSYIVSSMFKNGLIDRMACVRINEDETFEQFITRMNKNKSTANTYIKYIGDFNTKSHSLALLDNIVRFANEVKLYGKEDKQVEVYTEAINKFLDGDKVPSPIKHILGKQHRAAHINAILAGTTIIPGLTVAYDDYMAVAYEYYPKLLDEYDKDDCDETDKKKKSKTQLSKYSDMKYLIHVIGMMHNNAISCYAIEIALMSLSGIARKSEQYRREIDLLTEQKEKIQGKYMDMRNKQKELGKENKKLASDLNTERMRSDRLKMQVDDKGVNIDEFKRLQEENDRLRRDLEVKVDDLGEINRQMARKDKDIEYLTEKNTEYKASVDELTGQLESSKALASKMAMHRTFSEIPMQCFANAIKDKRVVLIGGDMMHTRIRDYGLDDVRLFKAGCREVRYEDLSDADLLVIITQFVDHSSVEGAIGLARTHNIPILKFGNKNPDMLVYAMFEEFYR